MCSLEARAMRRRALPGGRRACGPGGPCGPPQSGCWSRWQPAGGEGRCLAEWQCAARCMCTVQAGWLYSPSWWSRKCQCTGLMVQRASPHGLHLEAC